MACRSLVSKCVISLVVNCSLSRNLTESVTVMLEEGAVAVAASLIAAAIYGKSSYIRVLATTPGVMFNVSVSTYGVCLSPMICIVYRICE